MTINPALIHAAKILTDKRGINRSANNITKLSSSYMDILGPMGEKDGETAIKLANERRAQLKISAEMVKKWYDEGKKDKPQRI